MARTCNTALVALCLYLSVAVLLASKALAISPRLPFGDINVVVLTDVHSWVASHRRQEPYMDVDLGSVLSFWERLKEHCDSNDMDLFFVNNGDFVHGTGLSQMPGNPSYLIPLLEKMPYDAVNCGNHELYGDANVAYMLRPGGYVDWWGDRYLTSNIVVRGENRNEMLLFGNRYKILQGKHTKLLVFGFLYNMNDASEMVEIQSVEDVVKESWFLEALSREHYDAILVLAHMDLVDPLVDVIRSAIRRRIGEGMPVVFVTGHTHYRGAKQLEDLTMTLEAGKYMDTVGFVGFPGKESVRSENASSLFQHVFLDANQKVLFEETLGFGSAHEAQTRNGQELSLFIAQTRSKLGLTEEVGCAPQPYFVERHMEDPTSLWRLYRDEVVPKVFHSQQTKEQVEEDTPIAMLLSKGTWRYDLLNNATLIADDIIAVAPFNDTVVYLGSFTATTILQVNQTMNDAQLDDGNWRPMLPNYILIGDIIRDLLPSTSRYHLYSHEFDAKLVKSALEGIVSDETVVTEPTEFRSTLIWLAFVKEYWDCSNEGAGKIPDWLPTPQHIAQNRSSEDSGKKRLAAIMFLALASVAAILAYVLYRLIRSYVCQPSQSVLPDETLTLKGVSGNEIHEDAEERCSDSAEKDRVIM